MKGNQLAAVAARVGSVALVRGIVVTAAAVAVVVVAAAVVGMSVVRVSALLETSSVS